MPTKKVKQLSKNAIEAQVGSYDERDPEAELKAAREKGDKARAEAAKEATDDSPE